MQFKMTEWDFSNVSVREDTPLSEGPHTLHIESAVYNQENMSMRIKFRDIDSEEASFLTWFLTNQDGDMNNISIGTLNSLKNALAGPDENGQKRKGILFPQDMVGGLVNAIVKLGKPVQTKSGARVQYPNIYRFDPVDKATYEIALESGMNLIEQYVR